MYVSDNSWKNDNTIFFENFRCSYFFWMLRIWSGLLHRRLVKISDKSIYSVLCSFNIIFSLFSSFNTIQILFSVSLSTQREDHTDSLLDYFLLLPFHNTKDHLNIWMQRDRRNSSIYTWSRSSLFWRISFSFC